MSESSAVIVNVACGGWYPQGQRRLFTSLVNVGFGGLTAVYHQVPDGCPDHQSNPYAFKIHALAQARAAHPEARYLLWADASMYFVRDPSPLFEAATAQGGVAAWLAGWSVGEWCCDRALPILGITREEAFTIPLVQGGLYCVDTLNPTGTKFLAEIARLATQDAFIGPWDNAGNVASRDPRVKGHRHDMPALSVTLRNLGIKPMADHSLYAYWQTPWTANASLIPPSLVVAARGINQ